MAHSKKPSNTGDDNHGTDCNFLRSWFESARHMHTKGYHPIIVIYSDSEKSLILYNAKLEGLNAVEIEMITRLIATYEELTEEGGELEV